MRSKGRDAMRKHVHYLVARLRRDWQVTRQRGSWLINVALVIVALLGVPLFLAGLSWLLDVSSLRLIDILAVPIAIGAAVPLLNWLQQKRELDVEQQSAQDKALHAYLSAMSDLMINHRLRAPKPEDEVHTAAKPLGQDVEPSNEDVRAVARARTLTALSRLDAGRKRSVLQFLYESGLINRGEVIVDLRGADLSDANLSLADLSAANLHRADLKGADLSDTDLSAANLLKADLRGADLTAAVLTGAHMHKADLREADLTEANLREADLTGAHMSAAILSKDKLKDADLRGAHLNATDLSAADLSKDDLRGADLSAANLHRADLSGADLRGADLSAAILSKSDLRGADVRGANLIEANLIDADLYEANLGDADLDSINLHRANLCRVDLHKASLDGANLRDANLRDATGVTNELLDEAESLEGATMPNGQKYEDKLKYKDRYGGDIKNSGPS
jgi:uncharacterized protein YjbI with pentapeptide repeats